VYIIHLNALKKPFKAIDQPFKRLKRPLERFFLPVHKLEMLRSKSCNICSNNLAARPYLFFRIVPQNFYENHSVIYSNVVMNKMVFASFVFHE